MENIIIFGAKYLIYVLLLAAAVVVFKMDKENKKKFLVFAVITLPVAYVLAKISSLVYYDPRPFVVGNFSPLIFHVADNGFPSDHTLLSATVAATVCFFNKKAGVALFVLAALVGGARVLAGVHHVADIVGSMVIAIVVSYFIYEFVLPSILQSGLYRKLQK
ncbi:MAG: phosphatase PAP2 family protein [Candidatus Moranbacteria bacterium]|nr:phosphatase PAP2 family protein [Candidatus Moranbacteria bacterium]